MSEIIFIVSSITMFGGFIIYMGISEEILILNKITLVIGMVSSLICLISMSEMYKAKLKAPRQNQIWATTITNIQTDAKSNKCGITLSNNSTFNASLDVCREYKINDTLTLGK